MAHDHTYRCGPDGIETSRRINAMQAIKAHCLECCGWSRHETERCSSPKCALYPFRLGDSGLRRELTEEQREEMRAQARKRFGYNKE